MAAGPKTFVSYASEDQTFVLGLVTELSAAGADLWVDTLDIPDGALWDDQIDAALKACPQMLLVISPASMKSQNVKDEVAYALKRKRLIVLVLHEECDDDVIPYRIERIQLIDLRLKTEHAVRKVLRALNVPPQLKLGASLVAPLPAKPNSATPTPDPFWLDLARGTAKPVAPAEKPPGLSWMDIADMGAPPAAAPASAPASPPQTAKAPYRSPFADMLKELRDAEPAKQSKSKR